MLILGGVSIGGTCNSLDPPKGFDLKRNEISKSLAEPLRRNGASANYAGWDS